MPLQDLLGLGSEARFNVPGRSEGNWAWRIEQDPLPLGLAARVAREVALSGRDRPVRVGYAD
ncbi:MAG: 4-alpha-glucanotransferase [Myxococcota bacterium]